MPAADDPGAYSKPVTPLQLFEGRRSRRRREAPKVEAEDPESKVQYTVCIWWVLGALWRRGGGERPVGRGGSLDLRLYSWPLPPAGARARWGCLAWQSQTSPS